MSSKPSNISSASTSNMNGNVNKASPAQQRLAAQDGNWRRPRSPALAIPGATITSPSIKALHRSPNAAASSFGGTKSHNISKSLGEQRSSGSGSSHLRKSPLIVTPHGNAEPSSQQRQHRLHPSSADDRPNNSIDGRNDHCHHKDASTTDSWRSHHTRINQARTNDPSHPSTGGSLGSTHHQRRHAGFVAASNASEVARRAFLASEIGSIGSPSSKATFSTKGDGSMVANSTSQREESVKTESTGSITSGSLGPAFDLRPLRVSGFDTSGDGVESKAGRQDWAETPSSSLPSLPSSPSWIPPAPAMTSGQSGLLAGGSLLPPSIRESGYRDQYRQGLGQKTPSFKHNDEANLRSSVPTKSRSLLTRALPNGSPARHPLSLGATSTSIDVPASNVAGGSSRLPVPGPADDVPSSFWHSIERPSHDGETERTTGGQSSELPKSSAIRRESVNSTSSLGGHSLQHSRHDSASTFSSPSAASNVSARQAYGGVYRPPHMRNQGSSNGLKPVIAHYDRIRTPSLRGSLRSPEPAFNRSRSRLLEESASSANTPLAAFLESTVSSSRIASPRPWFDGQRRPVSNERSGYFELHRSGPASVYSNILIEQDEESEDEQEQRKNDGEDRVSKRPSVLYHLNEDNESLPALDDDFDLSHEDMLQHKTSLTESYCRSRARRSSASSAASSGYQIGNGVPVVDIFEVGDRLGPGMIHDGYPITIAKTTEGFQSQQGDVTGTRLEVKSKLGEGSYAVVYLVEEIAARDGQIHVGPRDDEGLMMSKRGGREIAGHQKSEIRNDDEIAEGDTTLADTTIAETFVQNRHTGQSNYTDGDLSSTLRATRGTRNPLARRAAEEEDEEQRCAAGQADSVHGDSSWSQMLPGIDEPHEGRLFALKCLCKRDLSEEMLELQRLEATIHQSIPPHKNIITLYRTYETPEWLFLVLEYCPGQDLYYWLEQAHDVDGESEEVAQAIVQAHESSTWAVDDDNGGDGAVSPDGTPPSPSLLASTSNEGLLSRKRLRLISKMFRQVCEAVQFCHDAGIAHRDLKPENLIVYDRRGELDQQQADEEDSESVIHEKGSSDSHQTQARGTASRRVSSVSSASMSTRSVSNASFSSATTTATSSFHKTSSITAASAVIVKLTDFGLATADAECRDFSCGSRPYMSPECHLNLSDTYDPFQADVWSLGIVLLNMIFHRSPFKEPNSERCPSFASYCYDPVEFLMRGFEGLTRESAEFLSSRVLCNVVPSPLTENPEEAARQRASQLASRAGKRVTPREFAQWAKDLPSRFGLGKNQVRKHLQGKGFSADHTSPLAHSRAASFASRMSAVPHSAATVIDGSRRGGNSGGELDSPGSRGSADGQIGCNTSDERHSTTSHRHSPLPSVLGLHTSTLSPPSLVKSRLASPLGGGGAIPPARSPASMASMMGSATSSSPASSSVDGHLSPPREGAGAGRSGSASVLSLAVPASPSPTNSTPASNSSSTMAGKRLHNLATGSGGGNSSAVSPSGSTRSGDGSLGANGSSGPSPGGTGRLGAAGPSRSSSSFTVSEVLARMLEREVKV